MSQWNRLLAIGPLDVTVQGRTLHARPTGNDVPIAFQVEADRKPQTIKVQFRYSSGMDEIQTEQNFGDVTVRIGVSSRRLFGFELRGVKGKDPTDVLQLLLEAVKRLSSSATLAGPRVNYEATRRGLSLESRQAPPPWMLDALERLRGSDPYVSG